MTPTRKTARNTRFALLLSAAAAFGVLAWIGVRELGNERALRRLASADIETSQAAADYLAGNRCVRAIPQILTRIKSWESATKRVSFDPHDGLGPVPMADRWYAALEPLLPHSPESLVAALNDGSTASWAAHVLNKLAHVPKLAFDPLCQFASSEQEGAHLGLWALRRFGSRSGSFFGQSLNRDPTKHRYYLWDVLDDLGPTARKLLPRFLDEMLEKYQVDANSVYRILQIDLRGGERVFQAILTEVALREEPPNLHGLGVVLQKWTDGGVEFDEEFGAAGYSLRGLLGHANLDMRLGAAIALSFFSEFPQEGLEVLREGLQAEVRSSVENDDWHVLVDRRRAAWDCIERLGPVAHSVVGDLLQLLALPEDVEPDFRHEIPGVVLAVVGARHSIFHELIRLYGDDRFGVLDWVYDAAVTATQESRAMQHIVLDVFKSSGESPPKPFWLRLAHDGGVPVANLTDLVSRFLLARISSREITRAGVDDAPLRRLQSTLRLALRRDNYLLDDFVEILLERIGHPLYREVVSYVAQPSRTAERRAFLRVMDRLVQRRQLQAVKVLVAAIGDAQGSRARAKAAHIIDELLQAELEQSRGEPSTTEVNPEGYFEVLQHLHSLAPELIAVSLGHTIENMRLQDGIRELLVAKLTHSFDERIWPIVRNLQLRVLPSNDSLAPMVARLVLQTSRGNPQRLGEAMRTADWPERLREVCVAATADFPQAIQILGKSLLRDSPHKAMEFAASCGNSDLVLEAMLVAIELQRGWSWYNIAASFEHLPQDHPQAHDLLLQGLERPEEYVQRKAASALAKLGQQVAFLVPDLLRRLRQLQLPDLASYLLVHIGEPSVPGLTRTLQNPRVDTRVWAAWTLGWMANSARPAIPELCAALHHDEDPLVRAAAAEALGRLGNVAAAVLRELRAYQNDPEEIVRDQVHAAVEIIARGDPPQGPLQYLRH